MSDPFRTDQDYELLLYSLRECYPIIRYSTLTFVRQGRTLARVMGEVFFSHDFRLVVRERLIISQSRLIIDGYGYEVWQSDKKLFWYDSQPHPHEPTLQSTHPHHKHVPPDIKRNRIPAPNMSFTRPNLPALINEIELLLAPLSQESNS